MAGGSFPPDLSKPSKGSVFISGTSEVMTQPAFRADMRSAGQSQLNALDAVAGTAADSNVILGIAIGERQRS